MSHRSPEPGLEPGRGSLCPSSTTSTSSCCLALACDPAGVRSTPSPASGRYSLPRPVLDRLQAALAPAKNREAALVLAVFLARYWSAPARLGQAFPIDRRALCGHRDLPLTEARVRGAIAALEEVGFLERIVPEPGRRYQPTADGLHRRPLAFHFGAEFRALFEAANKRPRRGPREAQDGRRPLPASPLPATRPRPSWSPPRSAR